MKKRLIYLTASIFIIIILSGCGNPPVPRGTTNVPITEYTISGVTITPSPNNPFSDNISVPSFTTTSKATLITLVKTQAPAQGTTFSENISMTTNPTFATYQTINAINNLNGKNGITGFAQTVVSAYNNPFAGEEVLRQSEANMTGNPNISFVKKNPPATTTVTAPSAFINPAAPPTVGSTDTFWVNKQFNGLLSGDVQVSATCLYVGPNVYIYVDNLTPASATTYTAANLTAISNAFDAIYAADRSTFGSEYKPGIDGDNHVTILISPQVNSVVTTVMGYFWGRDEAAVTTGTGLPTDHSNQREMFYVIDTPAGSVTPLWADAATTAVNAKQGYAVIAHEFQHMINYYHKTILHGNTILESTWLNEGLAMYAMQVCGYGMPQGDVSTAGWVQWYLAWPEQYSLTNWVGNYGMVYLYVLYLVEHYGGGVGTPASQAMLQAMESNALAGIFNVESVTGAGSFGIVFRNWAMANMLDGLVSDPAYNYQSITLNGGNYGGIPLSGITPFPVPLNFSGSYPASFGTIAQPGWSACYQRFANSTSNGSLNISIVSGNPINNLEAVLIVQ